MHVKLTPKMQLVIDQLVGSGRYNSTDEVIREAVLLLGRREEAVAHHNRQIRSDIEEGWLAAKRGELVDGAEVFDRLDAELAALER